MALYKIHDFNPNYRDVAFGGEDIKGLDVYAGANTEEKVGTVYDALVDENGRFRYLVIDTGFWVFGKKVLLPVGRCRVDSRNHRVYATGLSSKEQAEQLPEYRDDMTVDYDYEENVRGVYRTRSAEESAPVEMTPPVEGTAMTTAASSTPVNTPMATPQPMARNYTRDNYTYDREPSLYEMNDRDHQTLRLYEERLVTDKHRNRTGAVEVGKRVETETARASVPVERERVVIERNTTPGVTRPVTPGDADFREGEVARIDVYEETADIKKQAFVREEVNIRKEVERDTVEAEETLRRERLDIDTEGNPVVERPMDR
jgi:uncharacterized protein (TIGR02271 family)